MRYLYKNINVMNRFIIKRIQKKPINRRQYFNSSCSQEVRQENKENKKENVMNTKEKIEMAKEALGQKQESSKFKKVRKDKGLIERTESSITVLTEDNKELLKD